MKNSLVIISILFFAGISCNKQVVKPSAATCNDLVAAACSGNDNVAYCTFGFKWGTQNPFVNAGAGKPGPGTGMIEVSYKFQDAGLVFDTHSQSNLTSVSFDKMLSCSKQKVRDAFATWESVTSVKFVEKTGQEAAEVKLIVADIKQGGIAYPPIPNQACGGLVIFNSVSKYTCDSFYTLALHEIGHVLGLGHVKSNNVMNPNKYFLELQPGDIQGMQSIYGKK